MNRDGTPGSVSADGKTTETDRAILLVHGRDFKPAAAQFADVSFSALRAGIARDFPDRLEAFDAVRRDLAYFGDLANDLLKSRGGHYDETLDIGDRRNALNALLAVPARRKFGIRQYDRLPGKTALKEFLADIAAPILGGLGMTMPLISCVSTDCAEYLSGKGDYAENLRERLRVMLCELFDRGRTVMLMAHGMGCIVAYDVLWQLSHDADLSAQYGSAKVDIWVTLGAPLGDRYVQKCLLGAGEPDSRRFPTNVITWHNVSAEDDYTCHDATLADDFRKMLELHVVSSVHDHRIYNLAVRYGKSNPHSSIGYYIHPRVSKIVADWIAAGAVQPRYTG